MGILWWGYEHTNGSLHTKRYFDERDIDEARQSPFVREAYGPWECTTKERADQMLRDDINRRKRA